MVVNPLAGPGLWGGASPAATVLTRAGWQVDIQETRRRGHGTELARQAVADGYDIVLACGGDGTTNEVAQALAGTPVALGILPMGTANVLARELGLPLDPVRAASLLPGGETHAMDLGRVNARLFIMMAGIGLDAEVVREVEEAARRPPRLLKAPLLAWAATRRFVTERGMVVILTADGRTVRRRVLMVVVSNIRAYAGVFQIADVADWSDGLLDVVIFGSGGLLAKLGDFASLALRRHRWRSSVSYLRARSVTIWTGEPSPIQADGDIVGWTPATFSVVPQALRVLLPSGQTRGAVGPAPRVG